MDYNWGVIGAGPAGIAAVGKLMDAGVQANDILWIDPHFKVGDFGTLWPDVPSNTKVKLFVEFLKSSSAFGYDECLHDFALDEADPEATCQLGLMAEPLQWVTKQLLTRVASIQDIAEKIRLSENKWHITFRQQPSLAAKNIILATGAVPRNLALSSLPIIPLQDAMDPSRLYHHIDSSESIAVFGSSHSAILVIRNLVENQVRSIINFYRSPLRYAVHLDSWILFDDTGLKGSTAQWARENIDGKLPANLQRYYSNEENIEHYLPQCNKVVYAIGFERRLLPIIEGVGHVSYIKECGIIAPGLFGFGIGYPQAKYNRLGMLEYRVGLWKFVEYLSAVLPVWLNYPA